MPDQEPNAEGTPVGAAPTPTEPQAQAGSVVTMDAFKELLTATVSNLETSLETKIKNGINADLRRAGVFKTKDKDKDEPPPNGAAPAAVQSIADLEARFEARLEAERLITARATKNELTDAQVRRMRAAVAGVGIDRLQSEIDSYLSDLGLVKAPPTTTAQPQVTTTAQPSNPQPISDKGSPAPGGVLDWEREFAENPGGMSRAAIQRGEAKYGTEKFTRMRVEAALRQQGHIKVTRPQG